MGCLFTYNTSPIWKQSSYQWSSQMSRYKRHSHSTTFSLSTLFEQNNSQEKQSTPVWQNFTFQDALYASINQENLLTLKYVNQLSGSSLDIIFVLLQYVFVVLFQLPPVLLLRNGEEIFFFNKWVEQIERSSLWLMNSLWFLKFN